MNLRLALHQLAEHHELSPEQSQKLFGLAGPIGDPPGLARAVAFGTAVTGAALGGFGVILWVAANWETLGRAIRFGLLESVILVMCAGAFLRPAARVPLSILALLGIGGLFAYFGQTYQTGADPWQLFAWWSLLALPLCAGVRHDALWTPWTLVTVTGISLWVHAHTGHAWRVNPSDLPFHLAGWLATMFLAFALSLPFRIHTGAGAVSMRLALTLAIIAVSATALGGLFEQQRTPQFWLGLLLLALAEWVFTRRRFYDLFAISAVGLALNCLLVGLLVDIVIDSHMDIIGSLLVVGTGAAGLLAGTVHFILSLSRRHIANGGAA